MKGFEPPTYGLQIRCSTVELHQQHFINGYPHLTCLYLEQVYQTFIYLSNFLRQVFLILENIYKYFLKLKVKFQIDYHGGIVKKQQQKVQKHLR